MDPAIADGVRISGEVVMGDGVQVDAGAVLHAVLLEDRVRVGPGAVIGWQPSEAGAVSPTRVGSDAHVGANATIHAGVSVGRGAQVSAGAAVFRDVPPWAVAEGNPARIVGYVGSHLSTTSDVSSAVAGELPGGASLIDLRSYDDMRGALVVADFAVDDLPFHPSRSFWTFDVPSPEVRGEHAHRTTQQLIVCVAGQCVVALDDGLGSRVEVVLDSPRRALFVPTYVWASEYKFTSGSVEMVFASEPYNDSSYIRDYEAFLSEVSARQGVT